MQTLTRCLKIRVEIDNLTPEDFEKIKRLSDDTKKTNYKKRKNEVLYKKIAKVRDLLTRTANSAAYNFYQMRITELVPRDIAPVKGKVKPWQTQFWHLCEEAYRTLTANQTMNLNLRATVLPCMAQHLSAHFKGEHLKNLRQGKSSLATFKRLPLYVRADDVKVENRSFMLGIFSACKGAPADYIRATPLRSQLKGSNANTLNELLRDPTQTEYKRGDITLTTNKRGNWILCISYSYSVTNAQGDCVAGIDLGIVNTVAIAYAQKTDLHRCNYEFVQLPGNVIRNYNRVDREYRERRAAADIKEGKNRGRRRKYRALEAFESKRFNIMESGIREFSAHLVKKLQKRNVTTLYLENLTGVAARYLKHTEDLSARIRRRCRKNFFRGNLYRLKQYIMESAEKSGITCMLISPAYTSSTCSNCGKVWTDHTVEGILEKKKVPVETDNPSNYFGRTSRDVFRCNCRITHRNKKGENEEVYFVKNADSNAAKVILSIGVGKLPHVHRVKKYSEDSK